MSEPISRILGPYGETDPRTGKARIRAVAILSDGTRRVRTFGAAKAYGEWFRLAKTQSAGLLRPVTVSDAIEAFLKFNADEDFWGPATVKRNRQDLRAFGGDDARPVGELCVTDLIGYLSSLRDRSLFSQKKRWATVSAFVGWCISEGHILSANDPRPLVGKKHKRWLNIRQARLADLGKKQPTGRAEREAYVAAAFRLDSPADRVMALLPIVNGMSSGEVRNLLVGDIDVDGGMIHVRGVHLKNRHRVRDCAIWEAMRDDLQALVVTTPAKGKPQRRFGKSLLFACSAGRVLNDRQLRDLCKLVCEMAGIDEVSVQALRGAFSSHLAMLGKNAIEIGSDLGHSPASRGTTAERHYIREPVQFPCLSLPSLFRF